MGTRVSLIFFFDEANSGIYKKVDLATLLHSERPKVNGNLVILSALGLIGAMSQYQGCVL